MVNRYHRQLNLPKEYRPNVDFNQWDVNGVEWSQFHKSLTLEQLNNQKFVNFLNSLGLTSTWIEVFYTPPNSSGVIHSDNIIWSDWSKIVFQYGAQGSTMRWWKSDKTAEISTSIESLNINSIKQFNKEIPDSGDRTDSHYHGKVLVSDEVNSEMVYEAEIGNSSLVNVGPLHSSYNPTNEGRFVITVALYRIGEYRLLWDDAMRIFQDYTC
jgi:hypothetical protein